MATTIHMEAEAVIAMYVAMEYTQITTMVEAEQIINIINSGSKVHVCMGYDRQGGEGK